MSTHGENFSLEHYLGSETITFQDRFDEFGAYSGRARELDFVLREITGPSGPVVSVRGHGAAEPHGAVMLGSNNYLGVAHEPEIVEAVVAATREFGVGCGGPPLLNGTTSLHVELERRLAEFKSCEAAMLFTSGYAANVGWVQGLLRKGDVLLFDEQNHASVVDGIQLGRVRAISWAHNDLDDLAHKLRQVRWRSPAANIVVAVEGVYSMDGDIAPLPGIRSLCDTHGALLAVDDAHGTGVLGRRGRGTAEHFGLEGRVDVAMGTFSKTFATTGGFVAGPQDMIETLRFFSRPYMFSASLAIPVVASVLATLDFLDAHPERVRLLHETVEHLVRALRVEGFDVHPETAIIPLPLPPHVSVAEVVGALSAAGVFVNGVEFPAVPRDGQRLRLSVMATISREQIALAVDRIAAVARRFDFHPEQLREDVPR